MLQCSVRLFLSVCEHLKIPSVRNDNASHPLGTAGVKRVAARPFWAQHGHENDFSYSTLRIAHFGHPVLSLPQNTQNGLRPSRNTQKHWGCRGMEAGGLGVLCLLCAAKRLQCVQWRKKSRRFCNDLMIPIQLCVPLRVTVAILFRCRRIGLRTREHHPSSPTTSRARCAYRRGRSRSSHGSPRPFQRDRTPPQCPRPR